MDDSQEIPQAKRNDLEDPLVKEAARIIQAHHDKYNSEITLRQSLLAEAESEAFYTNEPNSTSKKLGAFLIYISLMKVMQQIKMQDWSLKGDANLSENKRLLMQAGLESFFENSYYHYAAIESCQRAFGTGDSFIECGANPEFVEKNMGFPFGYRVRSVGDVWFETTALEIFNPASPEREARRIVFGWRGQWSLAKRVFPWIEDGAPGDVPSYDKESGKLSSDEKLNDEKDESSLTQVLRYVDLDRDDGTFCEIGGSSPVLNQDILSGEEFPYIDRFGKRFAPIIHIQGLPTSDGILNKGIYHAVANLGRVERMLGNAGIGYEITNMNPIQILVHSPDESATNLQTKMNDAREAQQNQEQGVIFTKAGKANTQLYNLKAEPLINELRACLEMIRNYFAIWGINLQDTLTDPAKTAYAVMVEGESQTKLPRYLQNRNAIERERALNMGIDWLIQQGDESWDMPLDVNVTLRDSEGKPQDVSGVKVEDEFGKVQRVSFTLGDLVQSLRTHRAAKIAIHKDSGYTNPRTYERLLADKRIARLAPFGITNELIDSIENAEHLEGGNLDLSALRKQIGNPYQEGASPSTAEAPPTSEISSENIPE